MTRHLLVLLCLAVCALAAPAAKTADELVPVGLAKMDITPELPIWLSGYLARDAEAKRVETPLYARALAIGSDAHLPAVLITVELIGVSQELTTAVAAALEKDGVESARLAICATHTHNGPSVAGVLPYMFARDLPEAEVKRIDRYTEKLQAKLIEVARTALANRQPARLAWGQGSVDFAMYRRKVVNTEYAPGLDVAPTGPVDHTLPVLRVTDPSGKLRGVFLNYACHCTTLSGGDNFVHSDWAGNAAMRVEQKHRDAVALVAIGCGADANPRTRSLSTVATHGEQIAREVDRLLAGPMRPLRRVTYSAWRQIPLPLDREVTRAELERRRTTAGKALAPPYAAGKHLARLDAGGKIATSVPYRVQVWSFDRQLVMVFLNGEVVSEYALRLRRELDGSRLWVNAYANALPCYIPSRRMYSEGTYEVDGSMDYYGWPVRLARGTEDMIVGEVKDMVDIVFRQRSAP